MIVLGVLLLIGSGGFAAALVLSNLSARDQAVQLAGSNVFHWQTAGIFLAGMVVAGAFGLGLYLCLAGGRHRLRVASRGVSQRREVRALRSDRETTAATNQGDRTHLVDQLVAERADHNADHKADLQMATATPERKDAPVTVQAGEGS